ncbi:cupredoxin domain-containing protein [Halostagnicola bangensis]
MKKRELTRRRVLQGVTTGSIVLTGTAVGDESRVGGRNGRDTTAALETDATNRQTDTSSLEIDIVETSAPVNAGEHLRVTAEIENTGSSDVRADVDFVVGHAEERLGRQTMTIEAGETESVNQGFDTYPVRSDDEFPVRIEISGVGAERTVAVDAASELPNAMPNSELTVQPGTTVLFEVEPVDPDESHEVNWWIDGESTGAWMRPWTGAYFAEVGRYFHMHTFDSTGTHEVAASVARRGESGFGGGNETYAAYWEIDVSSGGKGSPSIERRQPAEETLEFAPDDDLEFELEVSLSGSDRSLDRVVWWLTQSDTILDVTDLSGTLDTATLPTTESTLCHTCRVSPWIVCADGTTRELDGAWIVNRVEDDGADDGTLEVRILETNSPVEAGGVLEAIIELENAGESTASDELEFIVGHDPERVDTQAVTVSGGDTGTATLAFETYPTSQDEQFPVRVVGADDADETMVEVIA